MGLNEFILGLNNLETITRAPGFLNIQNILWLHIPIVSLLLHKC